MCVHGSKLDFYPKLFHLYPLLLHLINVSYLNANHLYIKCWRQMGNAIYFNLFYFNTYILIYIKDIYWGIGTCIGVDTLEHLLHTCFCWFWREVCQYSVNICEGETNLQLSFSTSREEKVLGSPMGLPCLLPIPYKSFSLHLFLEL